MLPMFCSRSALVPVFFALLLLSPTTQAGVEPSKAPTPATDEKPVENAASTGTPRPFGIPIAPHRAIYEMKLGSVKNGGTVTGASGKMLFEWADTCDGWAVQQRLRLHFSYAEGDETDIDSTIITWESKDGKRYNFNVRRLTDGKETENYRGKATLGAKGGSGKYTLPKAKKDVNLAADALFPSNHTEVILQKALGGEKFFTRPVFDGSDEDGVADVSAFIGPRQESAPPTDVSPALRDNPLLKVPGWPVRLAFFKITSETGEPDYEMNLFLLENGVAKSMQLDYSDFTVSGTLTELEPLPKPGC
jgi:hypothetical protein